MAELAQHQTVPAMNGSAHPFTCNTCQVAFRSSDLQRTHMQSDWHRYNLKRRVASLPPLTSEVFAEKVLANKATAAATAARASFEKRCDACEKSFFSEGAYINHIGSGKHKLLTARLSARGGNETESMADSTFSLGDPMETASTTESNATVNAEDREVDPAAEEDVVEGMKKTGLDSSSEPAAARPAAPAPSTAAKANESTAGPMEGMVEEEEEYVHKADLNQCLFCNYISPTLDLNLNHMSRQHGFFIPEKDYLINMPGLINYLSETIATLHSCLYCAKNLHTALGVQTHMRDRGHCMVAYGTEEEQMEIGEFYDFRSTYSDEETEDEAESGGVSLGVKRAAKTTTQGEDGEEMVVDDDDEGWESDSSLSSVPTDEITSVPLAHKDHMYAKMDSHRHHSHTDPRPHKNGDGFHSHAHSTPHAVYHDDYELHLPSGRTAGHRSLRAYYRQNLRNYPSAEEREEQRMLEDSRHDSDADDEETASQLTEGNGRGRQVVSRANGGTGMVGVSELKKREVRAVEKREQKRAQRSQRNDEWQRNKKGNSQKHFRDPLLQ